MKNCGLLSLSLRPSPLTVFYFFLPVALNAFQHYGVTYLLYPLLSDYLLHGFGISDLSQTSTTISNM